MSLNIWQQKGFTASILIRLALKIILGVPWKLVTNEFVVKVAIVSGPMTHWGLLSMLSQVYDSKYMLVPFLLVAHRLVQT